MAKYIFLLLLTIHSAGLLAQIKVDKDRSVPLWMEYDATNDEATIRWIEDTDASAYEVSDLVSTFTLSPLDNLPGTASSYTLGGLTSGEKRNIHIKKDNNGRGIIQLGIEIPIADNRGRCLLVIDNILTDPLTSEIDQMLSDIAMDGWLVDSLHVSQNQAVNAVKSRISGWHEADYELSQTVILLGHVPVPYSGNSAYDGHGNHQGAWSADAYYGELDGNWTDVSVDNTTPSRAVNKNVPDDGKYDQSSLPSDMELEIGRIDFHNLPAFPDDEIELTRQYLRKNHEYKAGNKPYPRRALVENNFGSLTEGFGQSGWRNFSTMFTGDSVSIQNYETVLETEKYLFSYAAGGGSYTSCGGVGTTQNLWVAKDIQTIFTLTFGSYFGDWDSQNNFMRSALASGDILTNAWAGLPTWQLYDMALGLHIGHCVKSTQNATGSIYNAGFGARSSHIALMGDPTLRLHAMKPASELTANIEDGNIVLNWQSSEDATNGYVLYRQKDGEDWQYLSEVDNGDTYTDLCFEEFTDYEYMVKAVRLEMSGSGSYYNTSLGTTITITTQENTQFSLYYLDNDMDGYGDQNSSISSCTTPIGYVGNDMDCDDDDININPDAEDIVNNGIDEDCDGNDLISSIDILSGREVNIFPNPAADHINISIKGASLLYEATLYSADKRRLISSKNVNRIDLNTIANGIYFIELRDLSSGRKLIKKIVISK